MSVESVGGVDIDPDLHVLCATEIDEGEIIIDDIGGRVFAIEEGVPGNFGADDGGVGVGGPDIQGGDEFRKVGPWCGAHEPHPVAAYGGSGGGMLLTSDGLSDGPYDEGCRQESKYGRSVTGHGFYLTTCMTLNCHWRLLRPAFYGVVN